MLATLNANNRGRLHRGRHTRKFTWTGCIVTCLALVLFGAWIYNRVVDGQKEPSEIRNLTAKFQDGKITFVAVGDWGDDNAPGQERQRHVAAVMERWCSERSCDFIVSTGDNFYPDGTSSRDDGRYNSSWRDVYAGPAISNLTWFMSLGNHDHRNEHEIYQLQFGEIEERWYLPWYYYGFQMKDENTSALFYAMDSESLNLDKYNPNAQIADMKVTLSSTEATWKIVFGHHPPLSVGLRWGDKVVLSQVVSVCTKYDVDALITGHDHNLQHIVRAADQDVDYVVSGAGGRKSYNYNEDNEGLIEGLGYESRFFQATYGFVGVTISDSVMTVDYYDYELHNNTPTIRHLYNFTRINQ